MEALFKSMDLLLRGVYAPACPRAQAALLTQPLPSCRYTYRMTGLWDAISMVVADAREVASLPPSVIATPSGMYNFKSVRAADDGAGLIPASSAPCVCLSQCHPVLIISTRPVS